MLARHQALVREVAAELVLSIALWLVPFSVAAAHAWIANFIWRYAVWPVFHGVESSEYNVSTAARITGLLASMSPCI
jgi:hypothetical protein